MEPGFARNFCTHDNGADIISASSAAKGSAAANMLASDNRVSFTQLLWLSDPGLPQSFTIDMSNLRKVPRALKVFGVKCWHSYSSNPAAIELYVGRRDCDYVLHAMITLKQQEGAQYFAISPLILHETPYLKIVISKTFGADKTYINQVLMLEESPGDGLGEFANREDSRSFILKDEIADQLKEAFEGSRLKNDIAPLILSQLDKENCGHATELEQLRRQAYELSEKAKHLQMLLDKRCLRQKPQDDVAFSAPNEISQANLKRIGSHTSSTTLLLYPTATFGPDGTRHFTDRVEEDSLWAEEIARESNSTRAAPEILTKLQAKLAERSRKLEMLEKERRRRLKELQGVE